MISVSNFGHRNYGRFGNQLFQYSLAKILSVKHNCNFYLNPPKSFLSFFDSKLLTYKNIPTSLQYHQYIEQDAFGFDKNIYDQTNIDLVGFFQNLGYYEDDWPILQQELVPNSSHINATIEYLKSLTNYTLDLDYSICMHFRRTDYTVLKNRYGYLDASYYLYILQNYIFKYKHIFIISDDVSSVKQELSRKLPSNIYFIQSPDILYDFYTMYLSRINIIANSTFSWWASILSSFNYTKKIFAPTPWLRDRQNINLYPENWHKINSNILQWSKLFV